MWKSDFYSSLSVNGLDSAWIWKERLTIKVEEVIVLVDVWPGLCSCPSRHVLIQRLPLALLSLSHAFTDVQRHTARGTGRVLLQPGAQTRTGQTINGQINNVSSIRARECWQHLVIAHLWKRCPQGSLRAVVIESQQIAQSSLLANSSSGVATANLHNTRRRFHVSTRGLVSISHYSRLTQTHIQ